VVPVVMTTFGVHTLPWGLRTNTVRLKTGVVYTQYVCLEPTGTCKPSGNERAVSLQPCRRQCGIALCRVRIYASLTPRKDAEMIIHGRSLTSHSFATALHAALRVLVDDLERPSFNAAVS
jgi:hypothetical protein